MEEIIKELQTYIHLSKYSRWLDDINRRETWDETINRLRDFWLKRLLVKGEFDQCTFGRKLLFWTYNISFAKQKMRYIFLLKPLYSKEMSFLCPFKENFDFLPIFESLLD